jgi:hypothetical protein
MTPDQFRKLALALPGAVEGEHMRHPDFRVGGRIFASLGPDLTWGMVKLGEEEQQAFVRAEPEVFEPGPGAWGRGGATYVRLKAARSRRRGATRRRAARRGRGPRGAGES